MNYNIATNKFANFLDKYTFSHHRWACPLSSDVGLEFALTHSPNEPTHYQTQKYLTKDGGRGRRDGCTSR